MGGQAGSAEGVGQQNRSVMGLGEMGIGGRQAEG